ncbi:MAG: MaoC family dehydratase N-terminal domain-containing protein [Proteobacteria bacterium]|nr:MaoC family dehydratase N-terminal domain-containing protein [Pseudomonadota bacterium]MCA0425509.1 MaoC family dehydratase N-terminal domain-containing protein [Pseudomonadota bacterium]
MSNDASLDIAHLRQWIGREETVEDIVSEDLARKFHAMLSLNGPVPKAGDPAPRIIHFCLGQPAVPPAGLGRDGHPARGGFLPPVGLPRRMWAGGAFTFHDELKVGDLVTKTSRIADVVMKDGRTGPLCFVTVNHHIAVDGRGILDERQDIVYRSDDTGAVKSAEPAPQGSHTRPFDTTTTTLFRYSALTFNGHRIHYDRRYAIEVEGYGGLVVHGPMQATLLHNFAAEIKGALPSRFSFRGLSPLIDDDDCHLHAVPGDGPMKLWTARTGGPVAMQAEAHW